MKTQYIYSPIGTGEQYIYDCAYTVPGHYVVMQEKKPENGLWVSTGDGIWKQTIDNSIFLINGQARQQRIQREQQENIKTQALALKKQVEQLSTIVMNEV